MLLTITTTHTPATDLGFLLKKHPERVQSFELSFGKAHVFYPEASADRCTCALLLDVDPVGMVRNRKGPSGEGGMLDRYVNDRPYVASSFLSVAIARVLGTALSGKCDEREELATTALPLEARLAAVPCRGGEAFLRGLFEPLGYNVECACHPLDPQFPEWGESRYYCVTLSIQATLSALLSHLYVLIPVLDDGKHYWVGEAEVEKLLRHGESWLADHPMKRAIAQRYLRHQKSLYRQALERLEEETPADAEEPVASAETVLETPLKLNSLRLDTVVETLAELGAARVLDLGCGEGRLLRHLLTDRRFAAIAGMDVSMQRLQAARDRLKVDRLPARVRARLTLFQGSLLYRDARWKGYDAAAVVEVVEHLDAARLAAFERNLFEFAHPPNVIATTPNREYNALFPNLAEGKLRHPDHRFEWTRAEFGAWAESVASRHGYAVELRPVGPEDAERGAPTQMAVFRSEAAP